MKIYIKSATSRELSDEELIGIINDHGLVEEAIDEVISCDNGIMSAGKGKAVIVDAVAELLAELGIQVGEKLSKKVIDWISDKINTDIANDQI